MIRGRNGRTVVLIVAIAFVATACAWGQAGGNAARNGANPFEPGLTADNVGGLALAWQANNASQTITGPVMNAKYVFTTDPFGYVNAYAAGGPASAAGATHCSGSPTVCTPAWVARLSAFTSISEPVVDGDQVFASANLNGRWTLFALNADPQSCPDTINGCEPVWSGQWGAPVRPQTVPSIAVADGRVYVSTPPEADGDAAHLAVFDELGVTGCTSGPPRACTPLFQIETSTPLSGPPDIAIAIGRLFIATPDETLVFDAAGQAGCTNGTCSPLYRLSTLSARGVSLFGTTAYAVLGNSLMAFDATGATGCAGPVVLCEPKWTAPLGSIATGDLPTVSGNRVLVVESPGDAATDPGLEAFDASGQESCGGTPRVCSPLWKVTRGVMAGDVNHLAATPALVIMSGWSVIPFNPPIIRQTLKTFDLSGTRGCNGTPKVCAALSVTAMGTDIGISSPAVAFGRIALSDSAGHLKVSALSG